jgi:hypothetical protein
MDEHLVLTETCGLQADAPASLSDRPTRAAAIHRQRYLAASEAMPPERADKFTVAQLAVLTIIAREVRTRQGCTLSTATIAARASVSPGTAQGAIRLAKRLGLIEVVDHRTTIVDTKWSAWLRRGRLRNRKQVPARLR